MNNDLISRAEAIDVIRSMTISLGGKEIFHPEAKKSVVGALDEIAAVDAEPVRHGRWIQKRMNVPKGKGQTYLVWGCSLCKAHEKKRSAFCPNCGAKMDAEVSE